MKTVILLGVLLALSGAGCKKSTSVTAPTPTTPPAAPTATEVFAGTLPVSGSSSYTFPVGVYGTVNVTLTSVGGTGVPATVALNIGIGTPGDTGCTTTSSLLARAGSTAQLSANETAGTYCVGILDVGNLFAPANFSITIAHP